MNRIYFLALSICCSMVLNGQDELTLDSCRARVLEHNPTLKQQMKRVESAEANMLAKKKDYLPTIDASGDFTYLQNPMSIEVNSTSTEGLQNLYSIDAPIIQNVYRGSVVRKSNEMAGLQKELAINSKEDVKNYLLLQTELAFWSSIYNKELLILSGKYKAAVDGLVVVIRDKVETEIISKNDLLLLEVRQNEAELFDLITSNQYNISLMELNRAIGSPLNEKNELKGNLADISVTRVDYTLDSVLNNRPDIKAQSKKIDIQKTNADLVKSQYLPSVYVGVLPSWGAPNTNIGASDPNYNTSFIAGVNVPITRWGKRKQDVSKELLLADAASYQLKELQDEVNLEVNSTDYQLSQAIRRTELTEASLQKAAENLDIMTDRYLEGLTSILEVLDAQLYWQRSYKDMLDAQLYYKKAFAYHKNAIGDI